MAIRFTATGKQAGAFGGLGGELVIFEWETDPDIVANAMMQVAGYLENIEKPLLASLGIAREDTRKRFATETDPDGQEWLPLDEEYLAKKIRMGKPSNILQYDRVLIHDAPQGWEIAGDTLFYNPSVLPEYGLLHQDGNDPGGFVGFAADHRARIAVRRSFLRVEGSEDREVEKGDYAHDNLGIGRGNALPARPFIGLSIDAFEEITAVFDAWFSEAVEVFYNPSGGFMQERGAGGRFGPRVHA